MLSRRMLDGVGIHLVLEKYTLVGMKLIVTPDFVLVKSHSC